MKTTKLIKLCALSLSIFLPCSSAAAASTTANPQPGQTYTNQEILQQLVKAKIVYLGETHDIGQSIVAIRSRILRSGFRHYKPTVKNFLITLALVRYCQLQII